MHTGGRTRPVASSSALARAAPRRRSCGGRTSSTSIPAAIRCSPGSRSSPTSPTRSGSGRASRSRAPTVPKGRTCTGTAAEPTCSTSSRCSLPAARSATSISSVVQPCAGRAHGVAAADVLTVDAPQVHRDARHRAHLRLVPAQRLQTADGDAPPGVFEFVADADSARGQRAGDDGARTADGERAVHPQPHVGVAVRRRQSVDKRNQFCSNLIQIGTHHDRRIDDRAVAPARSRSTDRRGRPC